MDTVTLLALAVAVLAIVIAAWLFLQQRRSDRLSRRFGPEYGRAVEEHGDRRRAEAELEARAKRVEQYDIRPLAPADRERFAAAWQAAQARFVDQPRQAVRDADLLVAEVMRVRGYPVGDFAQRAADVSVDHPRVVETYRAAHAIAERNDLGEVKTEERRKAMIYYRALFQELLETGAAEREEARR